ncbi:MAG: YdeI/OmpD-associated family protein [Candidatus Sericytochromatia bacterium]
MQQTDTKSEFQARLLHPEAIENGQLWAFVILPHAASAKLPRRGRITVEGTLNGHGFTALLEPDGQKSHWLALEEPLLKAAGVGFGELAQFEIMALEQEPEPTVPADLAQALDAAPEARATWEATTTIARLDWIHWITSAKQAKTRTKRIYDACDMLAAGKKRVCCFDPSGYFSKAFCAPKTLDALDELA